MQYVAHTRTCFPSEQETSFVHCQSLNQAATGGPSSCKIVCSGFGQVGSAQCKPLQLFALKKKVCTASSSVRPFPLGKVRASSKPLGSLCDLSCNIFCLRLALLLQNLDTTLCSCVVLPQTLGISGFRFLPYLCLAQLACLGFAFTLLSM